MLHARSYSHTRTATGSGGTHVISTQQTFNCSTTTLLHHRDQHQNRVGWSQRSNRRCHKRQAETKTAFFSLHVFSSTCHNNNKKRIVKKCAQGFGPNARPPKKKQFIAPLASRARFVSGQLGPLGPAQLREITSRPAWLRPLGCLR